VTDVPEESGRGVAQRLIARLLSGVHGDKLEVKLECLDCLADLMKRFGHEVGGITMSYFALSFTRCSSAVIAWPIHAVPFFLKS
jgi:hypothetical protein